MKSFLFDRVAQRLQEAHAVGVGVEPVEVVENDRPVPELPQLAIKAEGLHVAFDVERRTSWTARVIGRAVGHGQGAFHAFALARAGAPQQQDQPQFVRGELAQVPVQLLVGRHRNDFARHGR